MKKLVVGGALGFLAGWALRAVFDSGRDAVVSLAAAAYGAADGARRLFAFEREYFEDLLAEAKDRFHATRRRREAERQSGRAGE